MFNGNRNQYYNVSLILGTIRRFSYNYITSIPPGFFTGLTALKELFVGLFLFQFLAISHRDFTNNNIVDIPGNVFSGLIQLLTLYGIIFTLIMNISEVSFMQS